MKHLLMLATSTIIGLGPAAGAGPPPIPAPPAPAAGVRLIDVLRYDSPEAAQRAWRSVSRADDAGARAARRATAGVEPLTIGGRPVLRFPCNFRGTTIPRGVWDRRVDLDLTLATAITFDVYVRNASAIGRCHLYIQSGDGWYGGQWYPRAENRWCRVRIRKSDCYVDKPAAGWSEVNTLRMSPWAAKREDAVIYVANLAAEEPATPAIVVRQEFPGRQRSKEQRSATRFTSNVCDLLEDVGLVLPMVGTQELSAKQLAGRKLVILPYVSRLPAEPTRVLTDYVRAGGKVLVCYGVPGPLAELLGVRVERYRTRKQPAEFDSIRFAGDPPPGSPAVVKQASWGVLQMHAVEGRARVAAWWHSRDGSRTTAPAWIVSEHGACFSHVIMDDDARNKGLMLAALAARFCPGVHEQMARARLAKAGGAIDPAGWQAAVAAVRALPAFNARAKASVEQAVAHYADARVRSRSGEFLAAVAAADRADSLLVDAYCRAQRSQTPEFRATWCHPPEGIAGWGWERTAKRLAESGVNVLILNALRGASTSYPSQVLPYHAKYGDTKPDHLGDAILACKKVGIAVHVWMTNYKPSGVGMHVSKASMARFKAEGRLQVDDHGKSVSSLCPTHEANFRMQHDAMVEVARKPGVAGVHFDYIRYPDHHTCFCKTCRAAFEQRIGRPVKRWPKDCLAAGPLRAEWMHFRCDAITRLVKAVHDTVRRVAPECKISAAVFRNFPACKEGVGQDWKLWVERGYLDFVCPMDYTASDAEFENQVVNQLAIVGGKIPCYPGIGLLKGLGPVGAIRQIRIARKHKTGGFVIWSVYPQYIDAVYPHLGKGVLRSNR